MTNKNNEDFELLHDLNLNEYDLSNEAKHLFPFHTDILEALNYCGRSALTNNLLSIGGKHLICAKITHSHNNVKNILNYLATKPLETKQKISDFPISVFCGLPHTDTTLLYNLMACDTLCRAPLLTDITMQKYSKLLNMILKNFEIVILYVFLAPKETNFFTWVMNQQNKDSAFRYHQTVLQMLHDVDPPRTHWQLKTPQHIVWIDTLLKYYPQASIIMPHRRLNEVIPSLCSLWVSLLTPYVNEDNITDLTIILKGIIPTFIDICLERIVEFRSRESYSKNVFDIQYEDLMKDPIGTVRRIYDHFEFLKWSDEFEKAMHTWLIDNYQGKEGRHSYSLNEFNLETQMDKPLYKDYGKMFLST